MFKKLSFVFILFSAHLSFGQKIEIGAGAGPTYYKGDLQPTFRIFNPNIGANIFARYNASRVFSVKANAFVGNISGNDKKSGNPLNELRSYRFKNSIIDYYFQIDYNFLNFRTHNFRFEHDWTPYLFAGYGNLNYLMPKEIFKKDVLMPQNKIKGPENILPFGVGYKKKINKNWNFGVEFTTRVLMNKKTADSFDEYGFSNKNVIVNKFMEDPINNIFNYPNTKQPDKYFQLSFTVSYLFYKVVCPPKR